jgi:hypothetical protein
MQNVRLKCTQPWLLQQDQLFPTSAGILFGPQESTLMFHFRPLSLNGPDSMVERSVSRRYLFVCAYHLSIQAGKQFTANHLPVNQMSPLNSLIKKGEQEVISRTIPLKQRGKLW